MHEGNFLLVTLFFADESFIEDQDIPYCIFVPFRREW